MFVASTSIGNRFPPPLWFDQLTRLLIDKRNFLNFHLAPSSQFSREIMTGYACWLSCFVRRLFRNCVALVDLSALFCYSVGHWYDSGWCRSRVWDQGKSTLRVGWLVKYFSQQEILYRMCKRVVLVSIWNPLTMYYWISPLAWKVRPFFRVKVPFLCWTRVSVTAKEHCRQCETTVFHRERETE